MTPSLGSEGQTWLVNFASRQKDVYALRVKIEKKKLATFTVIIKTISMTVCYNTLIRKQVCLKTVDCNTLLHIMKHIVKAIRAPECD